MILLIYSDRLISDLPIIRCPTITSATTFWRKQALRGVVRTVLADVAKKGLPGEHHFKITFNTAAPGVRLSDRMRAQYPETMTISCSTNSGISPSATTASRSACRSAASRALGGAVRCHRRILRSGRAVRFSVRDDRCRGGGEGGEADKADAGARGRVRRNPRPPAKARPKKSEPAPGSRRNRRAASGGDDKPTAAVKWCGSTNFRKK